MKISILTFGTRGDVQPFVALTLGLQKARHSVRLADQHRFADFAAQYQITFATLDGDPEEMSAFANALSRDGFGAIRSMADYVLSIAPLVLRQAAAACEGANLIVHSFFFTTVGNSLARAQDIPDVSVHLLPMLAPMRVYLMVALPDLRPGALCYFSHWLNAQAFRYAMQLGLGRQRHSQPGTLDIPATWPFEVFLPFQTPLLFAFSLTVLPQPADWQAPTIHVSG